MIVGLAFGLALLVGLVAAGVLGYGLTGQVRRLRAAAARAGSELTPRQATLRHHTAQLSRSEPGRTGRHRAPESGG